MNRQNCHCKDTYQDRLSAWAGQFGSPQSVARKHRFAWRGALAKLATPMLRLHHLRSIRTQMLHDALSDLDGCNSAEIPDEDA